MAEEIAFDIETTGLNPFKDRVISIAVKTDTEEHIFTNKKERIILEKFWSFLRSLESIKLIGFNSFTFDIPFLYIRSLKHKVRAIDVRYKSVDLRFLIAFGNKFKSGTLEDYSKLIGYTAKYNGYSGKHLPLLWKEGKLDKLKEYALQDVKMTFELYQKVKEIGLC